MLPGLTGREEGDLRRTLRVVVGRRAPLVPAVGSFSPHPPPPGVGPLCGTPSTRPLCACSASGRLPCIFSPGCGPGVRTVADAPIRNHGCSRPSRLLVSTRAGGPLFESRPGPALSWRSRALGASGAGPMGILPLGKGFRGGGKQRALISLPSPPPRSPVCNILGVSGHKR